MAQPDNTQSTSEVFRQIIKGRGEETWTMVFGVEVVVPVKEGALWLPDTQNIYLVAAKSAVSDVELTITLLKE